MIWLCNNLDVIWLDINVGVSKAIHFLACFDLFEVLIVEISISNVGDTLYLPYCSIKDVSNEI